MIFRGLRQTEFRKKQAFETLDEQKNIKYDFPKPRMNKINEKTTFLQQKKYLTEE